MAKRILRLTEQELKDLVKKTVLQSIGGPEYDKFFDMISDFPEQDKAELEKELDKEVGKEIDKDLDKLPTKTFEPVKSTKSTEKTIVGKLNQDFYEKLLTKLSAPVTDENLKFLYAWRQSEGDGGKYNPFNTTLKKQGSTFFNYLNDKGTVGVQNYNSPTQGLEATAQTLLHRRYACIVNGLRQNIGAENISNSCRKELKVWGTGDLISKVLDGYESGASIKVKDIA